MQKENKPRPMMVFLFVALAVALIVFAKSLTVPQDTNKPCVIIAGGHAIYVTGDIKIVTLENKNIAVKELKQ